MTTKKFAADIRQLIAKGELQDALTRLQHLLENSPKLNEVLLQSARHSAVLKQIRLGVISHEEGNVTKNNITLGLLGLLSEVEEQAVEPAIQEELRQAISIVNSKNVLIGSSITSGRDTHIGDTTIHTESDTSKRLRQFLFLFVPLLVIGGAYLWYQYQELKRPLQMRVLIENQTANDQLPEPIGALTLTYGGDPKPLPNVDKKALFDNIPASFKDDIFRLQYEADGFVKIDTSFHYAESIILTVRRNDDLASIKGTIIDEDGAPLQEVQVSIDCCNTITTIAGNFLLEIPTEHQRSKQRLTVFKEKYLRKDVTTPVQPGGLVRLVLEKK